MPLVLRGACHSRDEVYAHIRHRGPPRPTFGDSTVRSASFQRNISSQYWCLRCAKYSRFDP